VQSGSYLGEDDIVRFEDDYGRVEPLPAAATAGVTNVGVASTGVAGNIVEYVDTHEQL
jgi:mannose-1-phosphate guanylyltransferase/mannose-6-phosphate isomerase